MLAALFAGVFRYVDDHFHNPENFLVNTESLADNADVRERLFDGFRTEIIALAEGEDLTAVDADDAAAGDEAAGDEDAEADATAEETVDTPVTDAQIERDQAIEEILLDAFDSDAYRQMFSEQLASVQTQLIRSAELPDEALLRDSGQVNFDARRLYPPIYQALAADARTAEITQNAVPDTYGIYPIADRETTVNAAWWFVENGPNWRGLTFALAILSFIGAVAVAERRPSRIIQFGAGIVGLALVVVVVVYIVRAIVPLLAGGGGAGAVVATYAANLGPLVGVMFRLMILGVVMSVVGGIAKLIWPDDWVYGHVTDERGSRSIRRRRSTPEPQQQQPQQQVPVAAAVPVAYPPYGYPPAAPGWGAPYPGQPYGANPYQPGYPVGPFAQPGVAAPQYTGRPTVPVTQLPADLVPTGETPQIAAQDQAAQNQAAGNGAVERPDDAAQAVPRVVASAIVPDDSGSGEAPVVDTTAETSETAAATPAAADDDWDDDGDW